MMNYHGDFWTADQIGAAIERCEAETALLESVGAEDVTHRRQGINALRALMRESDGDHERNNDTGV